MDWCNSQNIPFFSKCFDIEIFKKENKQSTQLAARNLRYQWFGELRKTHRFTFLLTAHNLNDQFEKRVNPETVVWQKLEIILHILTIYFIPNIFIAVGMDTSIWRFDNLKKGCN